MAPVPKGNSSRGVLCADVSGKLYSGTLRRETIPCLVKLCEGQQFGAIPGGGTAVPSLALFCAIRRAQALRRPLGALFLDLRAAFYMSLTEVSLGALLGTAAREELLVSIGFTTEEIAVFLADFVEGTPLLRQLLVKEGSAPAWHKAIADWHVRTWFCVAGGSRKCFTSSGTRPGDPLADEVFCFSFAVLLFRVRTQLAGIGISLSVAQSAGGVFGEMQESCEDVPPLAYMDDVVLLIEADTGVEVLQSIEIAASTFVVVGRSFGFDVNFAVGKSEALVINVGEGVMEARAQLRLFELSLDGAPAVPCLPLTGGGYLRIVQEYKHLGMWQSTTGHLARELKWRCSSAAVACNALARPCLAKADLPVGTRVHAARACVVSRCLHGAGAWPLLKRGQFELVERAYHKPFRVIAGVHGPPPEGQARTGNEVVRLALGVLPVEWEIVFARLAFAPKVTAAPPYVLALVASPGGASWRQALQWSLRALQLILPGKLGSLPCPLAQPADWEHFWQSYPGAWKGMLRLARKTLLATPSAGRAVMNECRPLSPIAARFARGNVSEDEGFLCGVCDAVFSTAAGANTHCGRVHRRGSIVSMKQYVLGSACPICLVDFRSRVRAVHHLRLRGDASNACRTAILGGAVLPADPAALAEADAIDKVARRAARATGSGPLATRGLFATQPEE